MSNEDLRRDVTVRAFRDRLPKALQAMYLEAMGGRSKRAAIRAMCLIECIQPRPCVRVTCPLHCQRPNGVRPAAPKKDLK